MSTPEWVVGLGGSSYDFSAAVMRGTDLMAAVEEERLSRRKHGFAWWYQNPVAQSLQYCLGVAGIGMAEVDRFVSSDLLAARARAALGPSLTLYPHHLCHAASAYMMVPPEARVAIIVYDRMGSILSSDPGGAVNTRETISFFRGSEGTLECLGTTVGESLLEHNDCPSGCTNSIGMVYEMVTAMLGFDLYDTGKTMGLAAHGRPRLLEELRALVTLGGTPNDCFAVDPMRPELRSLIEKVLESERYSFSAKADVAASVQALLNQTLLACTGLVGREGYDVVALAGGCALNPVANAALVSQLPEGTRLLVPPHAGDAGLALGALWLHARERREGPFSMTFNGAGLDPAVARPGRLYSQAECEDAVRARYPCLARDPAGDSAEGLARILAGGEVVGLFRGRSEMGPRALGGRSILADPRRAMLRERINRELKNREPFRPLAPMILAERFCDYFHDASQGDPFMLRVVQATARCRREAPAVVHVDGTARVQVVGVDGDPFLRALIAAFAAETGVPMLLNTSLNRRGEPIVETPHDALDAALGMGLDAIHLEGALYRPVEAQAM